MLFTYSLFTVHLESKVAVFLKLCLLKWTENAKIEVFICFIPEFQLNFLDEKRVFMKDESMMQLSKLYVHTPSKTTLLVVISLFGRLLTE